MDAKQEYADRALSIISEYWQIRNEMIQLTQEINIKYPLDTQKTNHYGGDNYFLSNHIHDYFEADKENRKEYGESMGFDEYCMDVLDMDDVCPECAYVLKLIRKRRELSRKLGYAKNKIMMLGKAINKELA
jgi:hypothetical protein